MSKDDLPKLTRKQTLFVAAYQANGGNATEAAKTAGYTGNANQLSVIGHKNLGNAKINAHLQHENAKNPIIASAKEILEFWSETMRGNILERGKPAKLIDRHRASEALAKAKRMFVEQVEISNVTAPEDILGRSFSDLGEDDDE